MKINKNQLRISFLALVLIVGALIYLIINKTFYLPQNQVMKSKDLQLKPPPNFTLEVPEDGHYRLCIEDSIGNVLGILCDTFFSVGVQEFDSEIIKQFSHDDLRKRYFFVEYFNGKLQYKFHLSNSYRE